jgi:uncharacterized protein YdhG (YjbR/CyaY superfamily)
LKSIALQFIAFSTNGRSATIKGNFQFPLDKSIPLNLIKRIVKLRVKQNNEKAEAKRSSRKKGK